MNSSCKTFARSFKLNKGVLTRSLYDLCKVLYCKQDYSCKMLAWGSNMLLQEASIVLVQVPARFKQDSNKFTISYFSVSVFMPSFSFLLHVSIHFWLHFLRITCPWADMVPFPKRLSMHSRREDLWFWFCVCWVGGERNFSSSSQDLY